MNAGVKLNGTKQSCPLKQGNRAGKRCVRVSIVRDWVETGSLLRPVCDMYCRIPEMLHCRIKFTRMNTHTAHEVADYCHTCRFESLDVRRVLWSFTCVRQVETWCWDSAAEVFICVVCSMSVNVAKKPLNHRTKRYLCRCQQQITRKSIVEIIYNRIVLILR